MKKLLSVVVLMCLASVVLLSGCKKEETMTPPEVPSTNPPAATP